MSNVLANIYSAGNMLRRAVADMVRSPIDHAQKAIGYGMDKLRAVDEDLATSMSRSVLVPEWQKQLASDRVSMKMADQLGGAGIIVPAGAVPGMTRAKLAEISQQLSQNPTAAFMNHGVHRQPQTQQAVKNISDEGQRIRAEKTKESFGNVGLALLRKDGRNENYRVGELLDTSRYPPDLAEYLNQLTVLPTMSKGASFSPSYGIELGQAKSLDDLTSMLLHELQHGSQYFYDMPRGGSPRAFFQDYGKFSTAKEVGEHRMQKFEEAGRLPQGIMASTGELTGRSELTPDTVNTILGMLKKVDNKAHSQYNMISGEVEARLVQRMFEDTLNPNAVGGTPAAIMANKMGVNVDHVINPASVAAMPKVDSDPVTQAIINTLLGAK